MRPHYSQSSRENAIPFSGTSPLASYKEVPPPAPPPPPPLGKLHIALVPKNKAVCKFLSVTGGTLFEFRQM